MFWRRIQKTQTNVSSHVSCQLTWWFVTTHTLVWVSQLSGCFHSTLTRCWKLCFSSTHFKKAFNFFVTMLSWGFCGTGNPGHSEKRGYETLNMWSQIHYLVLRSVTGSQHTRTGGLQGPRDHNSDIVHRTGMHFQSIPWSILVHSVVTSTGNKSKFHQIKILFRIKTCSSCTRLIVFFLCSLIVFLNA